MKITLEPANLQETEVIIKGDLSDPQVEALLTFIKTKNNSGKLVLTKEDEQFFVDAKEVMYFEAFQGKVNVHTTNGTYQTKQKLYELTDALKTLPFAQISKSVVVNIDYVKSVSAEFSGNYSLKLKSGKEILTISRKYMKEFKSKI
ncbi:MAG: LytTR family transcriptional regulator DNA-binding domain-containing protein [Ruminococcus sp.]|nr:LytTR family transcriptional regulator DNA-binding domain-containing protein [Ruminococcus sp.]